MQIIPPSLYDDSSTIISALGSFVDGGTRAFATLVGDSLLDFPLDAVADEYDKPDGGAVVSEVLADTFVMLFGFSPRFELNGETNATGFLCSIDLFGGTLPRGFLFADVALVDEAVKSDAQVDEAGAVVEDVVMVVSVAVVAVDWITGVALLTAALFISLPLLD